ncbi:ribosome maturation factor RimM [Aliibacillus thermotolerans]|uniref:Ribosome maturation factor RimM n=1 Tax=Aliibacillus thermotolerans TaxID=1834418 RepID=A0ABW0U505_9BACI|nr:ribosome maturation factor RimM [Aliibacillus thermotolerans]MDA3130638.1 ribosome maturation factor RimM [Aliibacillus thermotolerans]
MMDWLNVGKIVNTHGIRGELKVLSTTDFEEDRFKIGNALYLQKQDTKERVKVTVEGVRTHKQWILLKLKELSSLNDAEEWKGSQLQIPTDALQDLEENEYYYFEIIDCLVVTEEGEQLGKVTDILAPGANDVWVVTPFHGKKEILIPYIEDVVKKVDVEKKVIVIHKMEGLLPS